MPDATQQQTQAMEEAALRRWPHWFSDPIVNWKLYNKGWEDALAYAEEQAAPVAELLERVEKAISTRTMLHVEVEALLRTLRGSP